MTFLDNIKMGPKLIASFMLISLFTVGVGVFATYEIKKLDNADTVLFEKMTLPLGQVAAIQDAFQRTRVNLRDAILTGDAATYGKRVAELDAIVDKNSDLFSKGIITEKGAAMFKDFTETLAAYREV